HCWIFFSRIFYTLSSIPGFVMKRGQRPDGYWQIVSRQFRNNRVATAGLIVVLLLFILAASADFIANDKPLVMSYRSELYFPVLKDYAAWVGVSRWEAPFQNVRSEEHTSELQS